jgi:hypothetical protein
MSAGGKQFSRPDFSDAVPPTPPKQGDMGPVHYVDEHTFESGSVPANIGAIESGWSQLIDTSALGGHSMHQGDVAQSWDGGGIRGFRTTPVGGTYNPGQGSAPGNPGTERSAAS